MSVLWNHILFQLTGHCALWISSIPVSLAPHPPSAGFLWLLALASVCGPKLLKSPTSRSLHLPSAWYAYLPSELFTWMSPLDVASSLMCQRETHILSSHPFPKTAFPPNLSTALPVSFVSFFQPWSYITKRCLSFAPKPAANKSHSSAAVRFSSFLVHSHH